MKRILIIAVLALLAHSAPVLGQSQFELGYASSLDEAGYLRLGLGTARTSLSKDSSSEGGFTMEAAAGVTLSNRVRWDVMGIAYSKWDGSSPQGRYNGSRLDIASNIWLGNFTHANRFRPYVGGGIGAAQMVETSYDDWNFAWAVGGGFEYEINSAFAVGPRYVFRQTSVTSGGPDTNANTHEFTLSIVWSN